MKPFTIDSAISHIDATLRTLGGVTRSKRPSPAIDIEPVELTVVEKEQAGRLMRVNHCGEVCAQALYIGQGLVSDNPQTRDAMKQAAQEESDHLAWCETRLDELETHTSYLNPFFFALSFAGGAITGLIGDKVNLGFVAATEEQVIKHLDSHIDKLPEHDDESRAILQQMKIDEEQHRNTALTQGGVDFPVPIKQLMSAVSKAMTRTTYWV